MIPYALIAAGVLALAGALLWPLLTSHDPVSDGRCELMRARETGLPARCEGEAVGYYTSGLGKAYPACIEHKDTDALSEKGQLQ